MILKSFLEITSGDLYNKEYDNRNKLVQITNLDAIKDDDELKQEFLDLINTAYKDIGGHLKFKNKDDIFKDEDMTYWAGMDIHKDSNFDIIYFGSKTKYGVKLSGVGHDGENISKKKFITDYIRYLRNKENNFYVEASGKISEILLKSEINVVKDEKDIEKVIGKPVTMIDYETGEYERVIAGHKHTKFLYGYPKI